MPSREPFDALFGKKKIVIGMVHLGALPGAPRYEGNLNAVIDKALADANTLEQGAVDGIMIENFFDAPFFKDRVPPETVASMTRVVTTLRQNTKLPLGVNVLRNDGISALAIATACAAQFVRINIVSWAMLADQGIIEGRAAEIARYRKMLGSNILIFTDCLTKHAEPLAPMEMRWVALDTWERGGVDALIISGKATGYATDVGDVVAARQGAPDAPILIGSGVTAENVNDFLPYVDGVLVGTFLKVEARVENPVELARVRDLVNCVRNFTPHSTS
ncbi:MAG TPA: BtpA/SgcQ family protein [Anaerolineae bacterium]|nr:BtpA/SgcQ family protein [Anaerolineae bacterium]